MRVWLTLTSFLLICSALALGACGGAEAKPNNPANRANSVPAADNQPEATDGRLSVPASIRNLQPPKPLTDAGFIEQGRKLYNDINKANCEMCHGARGKGDGMLAPNYSDPPVADLTAPEFHDAVSDHYIFWRIAKPEDSNAFPSMNMLGYPAGTEEEQWALAAYVRSLRTR